jgi:hypothetical protein
MPSLRRPVSLSVVLAGALLFAGCISPSKSGTLPSTPFPLTSTPSPAAPSLPACKLPKKLPDPSWVPKDLPLPDGIYQSQRLPEEAGYHRGLFVIPVSTVQFARFVLSAWPKAGWQLGRGDAEPGEVEDQFLKSPAFGAFKAQDMACSPAHSIMLLIYVPDRSKLPGVSTQGGSPLPGQTPTPSSTPFGPSPSPSHS